MLNKLIGAQILMQCTEQSLSAAGSEVVDGSAGPESVQSFSTCSEERSADGTVRLHFTCFSFSFFGYKQI